MDDGLVYMMLVEIVVLIVFLLIVFAVVYVIGMGLHLGWKKIKS